jgi:hypothetical protein
MGSQKRTSTRLLLAVCVTMLMTMPGGSALSEAADSTGGQAARGEMADSGSPIVVYYFHGDRRCKTCLKIEAYAEEVVKSEFAEELESGSLTWQVVNYDEPENNHFIKEFGLVSASLVVVERGNDDAVRFEVLQKTWLLVGDKSDFDQYVQQSIRAHLG